MKTIKRFVVIHPDGNVIACFVTKRAAERYAGPIGASVEKYNIVGICPIHRIEHKF